MAGRNRKHVLFLDTGSGMRRHKAVILFNDAAMRLGLPLEAVSEWSGDTAPVAVVRSTRAAVGQFSDRAEVWAVSDDAAIGREVSGLIARLLGGRIVADIPELPKPANEPPKKVHTVRVGRETAGRRGKGVTTVFDLPLTEDAVKELAATLKQKCGTGGTVKDGKIEIQGDHRDRIAAELEKLGYKVKRSGG